MKLKICHVTSVHKYNDGRIFYKECCSLVKFGYDVSLIAPNCKDQNLCGVNIWGIEQCGGRLNRFLKFQRQILNKAIDLDADVYHFHDPELLSIALKLKKRRKKVIFDSHEDVPNQIKSKMYIPKILRGIIAICYAKYEAYVLKRIDAIVTVSPNIKERLVKINANTYLITNYPILDKTPSMQKKSNQDICFPGQISRLWMHHNILLAISKIDKIHYRLAGPADRQYLNELQKMKEWEKVEYYGEIKSSDVEKMLANSYIGIALYDYCPEVGMTVGTLGNTKIFEYMRSGIPVICTDFQIWKKIIEKHQCGICVNPHNINDIKEAIKFLLNNPTKSFEMGRRGQSAVIMEYNWETQEEVLKQMYNLISKQEH